jgi:hypothetical protein
MVIALVIMLVLGSIALTSAQEGDASSNHLGCGMVIGAYLLAAICVIVAGILAIIKFVF